MKYGAIAVQYLFGLWMLVNGLNHYIEIFPLPPLSPAADAFLAQLTVSRLIDVAKIIEIIVGFLMLTNLFVPAAITLCMPVSVVIFINNLLLQGGTVGYVAGSLTLLLNIFLIYAYSANFMPLLAMRARVTGAAGLNAWEPEYPPRRPDHERTGRAG